MYTFPSFRLREAIETSTDPYVQDRLTYVAFPLGSGGAHEPGQHHVRFFLLAPVSGTRQTAVNRQIGQI